MVCVARIWLTTACVAHAIREQADEGEEFQEMLDAVEERPRWLGGEKCENIVPGAQASRFNWVRIRRCRCPAHSALDGPEEYCGDGTRNLFRASFVKDRGCSCKELKPCPRVSTQHPFDLESFISARWYIQQQMNVQSLPKNANNCLSAKYTIRQKKTFWGYSIKVMNTAKFDDGRPRGGELCAYSASKSDPAKLGVAPCFLPRSLTGPYWVLKYNETGGYALISGGQPNVQNVRGCRTGFGTYNSGLWIFTRQAIPPAGVVDKVRAIASGLGFDLEVLNPVNHENCSGMPGYD